MQRLRAGVAVFRHEHGRCLHHAHQSAGTCNDIDPVRIANGPQRLDCVTHAEVVSRLIQRLLRPGSGQIGQAHSQPFLVHGAVRQRLANAPLTRLTFVTPIISGMQTQRHLRQKNTAYAALVEQIQQLIKPRQWVGLDPVANQVGYFSGGLVGGYPLGQAAQILDQYHPQRGGQCPDLP